MVTNPYGPLGGKLLVLGIFLFAVRFVTLQVLWALPLVYCFCYTIVTDLSVTSPPTHVHATGDVHGEARDCSLKTIDYRRGIGQEFLANVKQLKLCVDCSGSQKQKQHSDIMCAALFQCNRKKYFNIFKRQVPKIPNISDFYTTRQSDLDLHKTGGCDVVFHRNIKTK